MNNRHPVAAFGRPGERIASQAQDPTPRRASVWENCSVRSGARRARAAHDDAESHPAMSATSRMDCSSAECPMRASIISAQGLGDFELIVLRRVQLPCSIESSRSRIALEEVLEQRHDEEWSPSVCRRDKICEAGGGVARACAAR